jgi:hypothetical protein
MIAEASDDMLLHLERDFDFEPVAIGHNNPFSRH